MSYVGRSLGGIGSKEQLEASPGRDAVLAPKGMPGIGFALHKMHNLIAAPHENRGKFGGNKICENRGSSIIK